jgi:hypothetical protein
MKKNLIYAVILVLVITSTLAATSISQAYSGIPTFSITSVVKDTSVTILTSNFPANDTFTVTMGLYGTLGVGGIVVDTTASGTGGAFSKTYTIPASLAGSERIAIRLQSSATGYYAYNWFYNNSTNAASSTPAPGYSGHPYINIVAVTQDKDVTIEGKNFTLNDTYQVTMGAYGTLGVGGIVIGTTMTGNSSTFELTYSIPASLKGSNKIAIRLQSPTSGYYAYNWFYNNSTGIVTPSPTPTKTATSSYTGYPSFNISAVKRDSTVTISAKNFPPNDQFKVTMGAYGTKAVNGILVDTTSSGAGGDFQKTYTIPAALAGSYRIAIRLESSSSGYFAYNWFYNNTTTP